MMTKMDPQDQVSVWHDLVRTGRRQLLIVVLRALYGGKDTARSAYIIPFVLSLSLCEAGLCFLVVRRCTSYCILYAKVQ